MPISQKTVFVVGAGAHHDYGMPTGKQLLDVMVQTLGANGAVHRELPRFVLQARNQLKQFVAMPEPGTRGVFATNADAAEKRMQEFAAILGNSGASSVDQFLERNQDYVKIGIRAMSVFLSAYEQESLSRYQPKGWYRWLFNKIFVHGASASGHTLDMTNVQIVTFNYDRLAEFYLEAYLRNSCASQMPTVNFQAPIEHVYGKLNTPFHWDEKAKMFACDVTASQDALAAYRSASKHIRIATTRSDENAGQNYVNARTVIAECSRLVFLGFGFNLQNLKRIGVPDAIAASRDTRRIHVFATALGLTKTDQRRIDGQLGNVQATNYMDAPCEDCLHEWGLD